MHSFSRRSLLAGAAASSAATLLPATGAAALAGDLVSRASRTEPTALVRVRLTDAFREVTAGFDLTEHVHDGQVEVVAWPGDRARLRAAGISWEEVEGDLGARFVADREF